MGERELLAMVPGMGLQMVTQGVRELPYHYFLQSVVLITLSEVSTPKKGHMKANFSLDIFAEDKSFLWGPIYVDLTEFVEIERK